MTLAALALAAFGTFSLEPTDDVWVYPHASDPSKDVYLRIWGNSARSTATNPADADEYSYSYLKFSTAGLPKDKELKEATLVVFHVAEPGYEQATAAGRPIEVRSLAGDFVERGWEYGMAAKVAPGGTSEDLFGSGAPAAEGFPPKEDFAIRIPLKGSFPAYLGKALSTGSLGLALASKIDPQEGGMRAIYRLWSRNADAKLRPKLERVFAD